MTRLVKIIEGPHKGNIAHVTHNAPQYGLIRVTPIYGDPLASIELRIRHIEWVEGVWVCNKCGQSNIKAHTHPGCNYGAIFHLTPKDRKI